MTKLHRHLCYAAVAVGFALIYLGGHYRDDSRAYWRDADQLRRDFWDKPDPEHRNAVTYYEWRRAAAYRGGQADVLFPTGFVLLALGVAPLAIPKVVEWLRDYYSEDHFDE